MKSWREPVRRLEADVRVLLVPNTLNTAAIGATAQLATWCAAKGLEPVLTNEDAAACDLGSCGVAPADIGDLVLAVALGGDGTILKAVHLLEDSVIPLLGVKFGKLGFLSGASPENMREAMDAALAGDVRIEKRATLRAEVVMSGRHVGTYRALNEVSVGRGGSSRLIVFDVVVGSHALTRMRADGVIVATATGSTAYALSAGGPVVAPGFGGMVVVPVAPHTLRSRPLVTDPAETVEIVFPEPLRNDASVIIDGHPMPNRSSLERVIVSRGEHDVSLVKFEGRDFYETVAQEFFGSP